jgi:maltose alpha-D-glucosyltransferase/alpha-amylase
MQLDNGPLWYKDAIIYELHVRSFYDSADDGVGDFRGLTQKLDYLQDLGITAVWVLPFCPSPLKDDGYDMSDYKEVHPLYGSLSDFEEFLHEAHSRGIRVITELALNHTSDQHCVPTPVEPNQTVPMQFLCVGDHEVSTRTRASFKTLSRQLDVDPVAQAHYWHRFYSHQPDQL